MGLNTPYSIIASQDGATARLGWTSPSTGITYCGLCLGSAIRPEPGELCTKCGGYVVEVFSPTSDAETIRGAWRRAWPLSAHSPAPRKPVKATPQNRGQNRRTPLVAQ